MLRSTPSSTPIRIARGFDDQGLWPALVVNLAPLAAAAPAQTLASAGAGPRAWQAAAEGPTAAQPPTAPPPAMARGAAASADLRLDAPAAPAPEPPVLVAGLKLLACLVALGGAYLASQFLWVAPAPAAPPAQLGSLLVKGSR